MTRNELTGLLWTCVGALLFVMAGLVWSVTCYNGIKAERDALLVVQDSLRGALPLPPVRFGPTKTRTEMIEFETKYPESR